MKNEDLIPKNNKAMFHTAGILASAARTELEKSFKNETADTLVKALQTQQRCLSHELVRFKILSEHGVKGVKFRDIEKAFDDEND